MSSVGMSGYELAETMWCVCVTEWKTMNNKYTYCDITLSRICTDKKCIIF